MVNLSAPCNSRLWEVARCCVSQEIWSKSRRFSVTSQRVNNRRKPDGGTTDLYSVDWFHRTEFVSAMNRGGTHELTARLFPSSHVGTLGSPHDAPILMPLDLTNIHCPFILRKSKYMVPGMTIPGGAPWTS